MVISAPSTNPTGPNWMLNFYKKHDPTQAQGKNLSNPIFTAIFWYHFFSLLQECSHYCAFFSTPEKFQLSTLTPMSINNCHFKQDNKKMWFLCLQLYSFANFWYNCFPCHCANIGPQVEFQPTLFWGNIATNVWEEYCIEFSAGGPFYDYGVGDVIGGSMSFWVLD